MGLICEIAEAHLCILADVDDVTAGTAPVADKAVATRLLEHDESLVQLHAENYPFGVRAA